MFVNSGGFMETMGPRENEREQTLKNAEVRAMESIVGRSIVALVAGFIISALLGKSLTPALRRLKAGQSIKEDGPTWHMAKQGTPTMGGIMFIAATAIVVLVLDIQDIMAGELTAVVVFLFAGVFGVIGFLDDYAKVKKKENTGLSASQKFLLQLAAALCFLALLRSMGILSPNLYVPFLGVELRLPWVVYLIFAALVITGSVNAVNITDGIDGLAAGVTLPVCAFFACSFGYAYLHWQRQESMGMTLFAAALCGALMGFLVHNFHPAKVFMGDTGSLFLGGAVCGMAFALDMPLILIPVGIIYIAETLSDIIQIVYFKATHGKRIFRMAPLHHHLELGGWSEKKLVFTFAGITLVFCVLAYFGVMGRFSAL